MQTGSFPYSRHFLWQVLLSVVVGSALGLTVYELTGARQASLSQGGLKISGAAPGTAGQRGGSQALLPSISLLPSLASPMNVLLLGVDSNGLNTDRFVATRTDTLMIVGLDPAGRRAGIVSIPRDTRVAVPGHGYNKINAAHALGGPELTRQTVEEAFGVPIDRYVVIDCQGFHKLVELLGPVEILVESPMQYLDRSQRFRVDLSPGLQKLDSYQTEEYVRFRHDARGDIGRIERQQWFLRQAANKLREPQIIFKLPQLISLAYECVSTDLSPADIAALAGFAREIDPAQVRTAILPGEARTIHGGSYWIPDEQATCVVLDRLAGAGRLASQTPYVPAEADQSPRLDRPEVERPLTVAIRYPRGAQEAAKGLEERLQDHGFAVRYSYAVDSRDCQHEQIVQNSARANDERTRMLKAALPELAHFPVILDLKSRPDTDFTLVLSPYLMTAHAEEHEGQPDSETPVSGQHGSQAKSGNRVYLNTCTERASSTDVLLPEKWKPSSVTSQSASLPKV